MRNYFLIAAALAAVPAIGAPFTLVQLPDTQGYSFAASAGGLRLFENQTQWIADNVATRNIKFVSHVGDIVDSGSSTSQWAAADAAMDKLDGKVAYGTLPGNHDYAVTGPKNSGLALYEANFGPARYAPYALNTTQPLSKTNFHGGFMPNDFGGVASNLNVGNSFQLFDDGQGRTYLHLALEWQPDYSGTGAVLTDRKVLAWAQSIVNAHPGMPTIVTTHEDLRDADPAQGNGGTTLFGQHVYNNLVRKNDQIFMVLSGHNHFGPNNIVNGDGEWRRVDTNDAGNPVFRMMITAQDWVNFGDGYMRLLSIDPTLTEGTIQVETYSPYRDIYLTDFIGPTASKFSYDLDFDARFGQVVVPEPTLMAPLALLALAVRRRRSR